MEAIREGISNLKSDPIVDELIMEADEVPEKLPTISEQKRALPNAILRSSLFGVVGKGNREYEENVLKATVQGLTVKFTGKQLDQTDLDVYLECVRRCAKCPLGELVRFTIYDFLKSISRDTGTTQYEWLKGVLLRLTACAIEMGDGRFFYTGHLLHEKWCDEKTGEFVIALNPKIAAFFSGDVWTALLLRERNSLKGKPLAQWLHGFYSSHEKPFQYKVETIKELCGSNSSMKEFRRMLKKSLSDLSTVTGWQCWVDESYLVNVKK
jgi:hypothetical protein